MTAIRGDYFGRKAFATIMGLSMLPNNFGMMVAPVFAGYMFDTTGSYLVPFLAFGVMNLLGALGMLFVRRPEAAETA
jgi:MFS family permease